MMMCNVQLPTAVAISEIIYLLLAMSDYSLQIINALYAAL